MKEPLALESPVNVLKGVGPARERSLASIGIRTLKDLFLHFPRRYEDRRRVLRISELANGKNVLVTGVLNRVQSTRMHRRDGRGTLLVITAILEETGERLYCTWFNRRGLAVKIKPGVRAALFGKAEKKEKGWEMSNPEIEILDEGALPETGIFPLYPLASGLSQLFIRSLLKDLFELPESRKLMEETLPGKHRERQDLIRLDLALEWLHFPPDESSWKAARKRIAYEELFSLQALLRKSRLDLAKNRRAPVIRPGEGVILYLGKILPYDLSEQQRRALDEIWSDLGRPVPMRRLLHGEVGSGKTAVAIGAAMAAIDSGQKVAFMVPTEVLANQHYKRVAPLLASVGVECGILTGGVGAREKSRNLGFLKKEKAGIVFGTHALFQSKVFWRNLGLVIVDEQHRFGVAQKSALVGKGSDPHLLVMSATPIPRTLTLTAYGELDVSRLEGALPGRQPVRTYLVAKERTAKLLERVGKEAESGGQVLWVCPHLEETENNRTASVKARIGEIGRALPGIQMGLVHGQMPAIKKEETMDRFGNGQIRILVATTVVEVGIDVAGATMIVIEDADRFGLSQLHQLRGRVGRGARGGVCVLLSSTEEVEAMERLRLFATTSDGFSIAEADLRWRGPGSLCGFRQHGVTDFRVADIRRDRSLLEQARMEAQRLEAADPLLDARFWLSGDEVLERDRETPFFG